MEHCIVKKCDKDKFAAKGLMLKAEGSSAEFMSSAYNDEKKSIGRINAVLFALLAALLVLFILLLASCSDEGMLFAYVGENYHFITMNVSENGDIWYVGNIFVVSEGRSLDDEYPNFRYYPNIEEGYKFIGWYRIQDDSIMLRRGGEEGFHYTDPVDNDIRLYAVIIPKDDNSYDTAFISFALPAELNDKREPEKVLRSNGTGYTYDPIVWDDGKDGAYYIWNCDGMEIAGVTGPVLEFSPVAPGEYEIKGVEIRLVDCGEYFRLFAVFCG